MAIPDHVVEACARAAHEVNRVYCISIGDNSQLPWEQAPDWQKESSRRGISVALSGATPQKQHEAWMADKSKDGWVYGPVKDADRKTHPCMVPYSELPQAQRRKDDLYQGVACMMAIALT